MPLAIPLEALFGGIAGAGACFFSNPLDVAKVRGQLDGELNPTGARGSYRRPWYALRYLVATEGISTLQRGLAPAMCYNMCLNGLRFGIYRGVAPEGAAGAQHVVAGVVAGLIGAMVASPFSTVRVRMQASTSVAANRVGVGRHQTTGFLRALHAVIQDSNALSRNMLAQGTRVGVATGAQFVSYDVLRKLLADSNMVPVMAFVDGIAAAGAAVAATVVMNPFDVAATRLANMPRGKYYGVWDCLWKAVLAEGVGALGKGFAANLIRNLPHGVITFMLVEQLRRAAGLTGMSMKMTHPEE